jgi:hypothetical protein
VDVIGFRSVLRSHVLGGRTPENPLRGMFSPKIDLIRMIFSPLNQFYPDYNIYFGRSAISIWTMEYTYKKVPKSAKNCKIAPVRGGGTQ